MNKQHEFANKKIWQLAIKYIVPSVFGMMFLSLQSIIDGFFVSNFVSENALASLNIVLPMISILMAISLVVSVGAQSLMGIFFGEKNQENAAHVFKTALIMGIFIAVIVALIGIFFAAPIARLLGASDVLIADSETYLRTISFFAPFVTLWFVLDYSLRVINKPILSLIGMILSASLNILLDFIFIKVLSMGIAGAALATGIAYSIPFLICIVPFFSRKRAIGILKGKFKLSFLGKMIYNGSSEGLNAISSAIVITVFNIMLMKIAGEAGVTAYTAIMYIMQIGFSLFFGIADGLRPIISYNYGAQNSQRLKKVLLLAAILTVIIGIIIFLVMYFFNRPLILLFVKTPDIVEMTVFASKICAFSALISGLNILASGYYTAINFAKESIFIALSRSLVFMLIGIFALPPIFGISGVWATVVFAEIATIIFAGILFTVQYKKGINH